MMDKTIAKRIIAMLVVGGAMLYFFYEPTEGNLINQVLELLSKRIVSTLGGVEP